MLVIIHSELPGLAVISAIVNGTFRIGLDE